ncbi:MAG: aromatic ring-hydroxylating dioxygenase subunit alpha [Spongiibacteraceae bacterium]
MTVISTTHGISASSEISIPNKQALWEPGKYSLHDAWFPVAHSRNINTQIVRRFVHAQPIFLWRKGKQLQASEFHPANLKKQRHQAGPFTGGSGHYPVVDRYGYAWVWYGNPERADIELIPDIPFISSVRGSPAYANLNNYFHCTYELVLENILDLTHIDFVHGNYGGTYESEDDKIAVKSTSETITMIRTTTKRPTSEYQKKVLSIRVPYQDVTFFTHVFIRSGLCFLHAHYSAAPSMPLMQNNTPESRFLTRVDSTFGVEQCDDTNYRHAWPTTGPMVAAQDESMLNPQNPRYILKQPARDMNTRFDTAGLLFRRRFMSLVERQQQGDFSYLADTADGSDLAEVLNVKRLS